MGGLHVLRRHLIPSCFDDRNELTRQFLDNFRLSSLQRRSLDKFAADSDSYGTRMTEIRRRDPSIGCEDSSVL